MPWDGDLLALGVAIEKDIADLIDDSEGLMAELALKGASRMRQNIDAAHTATGRARAAAGGLGPGRRDTDEMYQDVDFNVTTERVGDSIEIRGQFGWLGDDVPEHFLFQEYGDDEFGNHVPAMHALGEAFNEVALEFRERVS